MYNTHLLYIPCIYVLSHKRNVPVIHLRIRKQNSITWKSLKQKSTVLSLIISELIKAVLPRDQAEDTERWCKRYCEIPDMKLVGVARQRLEQRERRASKERPDGPVSCVREEKGGGKVGGGGEGDCQGPDSCTLPINRWLLCSVCSPLSAREHLVSVFR